MKDKEKFQLTTTKLDKIISLLKELKSLIISNTITVTDEPIFISPTVKPIIPKSKKDKKEEKVNDTKIL